MVIVMKHFSFSFIICIITLNYFVKIYESSSTDEKNHDRDDVMDWDLESITEDDVELLSELEKKKYEDKKRNFLKSIFFLSLYDQRFYENVKDLTVRRIIGPASADYVRTTYFSMSEEDMLDIVMKKNDLKLVHLSFAASSIKEASEEKKFATGYVQYLTIMHMLNFRVGALFFQKASVHASPATSALCSKMAAYLNIYNMILIDERLHEFSQIGKPSERSYWSWWWVGVQNYGNPCELADTACTISKNMANIKKITRGLNEIVELPEIKEQYPLQPIGPIAAETLDDEGEEKFEFTMPREFYINEPDKPTAGILEKWKQGPPGEKQYYFYVEAWEALLELYSPYLTRLINYFNSALFGTSPLPLYELYSFIPSYKHSLAIWSNVESLVQQASSDFQEDDVFTFESYMDFGTDADIYSNIVKVLIYIERTRAAAEGIPESELLHVKKLSEFLLNRANPVTNNADFTVTETNKN